MKHLLIALFMMMPAAFSSKPKDTVPEPGKIKFAGSLSSLFHMRTLEIRAHSKDEPLTLIIDDDYFVMGFKHSSSELRVSNAPKVTMNCSKEGKKCLSLIRRMLDVLSDAQNHMLIPSDLSKYDADTAQINQSRARLLQFKREILATEN